MILQQDMKNGNNIMPMLSKYLLLLLALYENLLIIIIGKKIAAECLFKQP